MESSLSVPNERAYDAQLLDQAAALLITDENNRYLQDASGFLRDLCASGDAQRSAERSGQVAQTTPRILFMLGQHAVETGNLPLAVFAFENASPADKWLLFSTAYWSGDPSKTPLSEWHIQLAATESDQLTPTVQAAREIALMQIALCNREDTQERNDRKTHTDTALRHREAFLALADRHDFQLSPAETSQDLYAYVNACMIRARLPDMLMVGGDKALEVTLRALGRTLLGRPPVQKSILQRVRHQPQGKVADVILQNLAALQENVNGAQNPVRLRRELLDPMRYYAHIVPGLVAAANVRVGPLESIQTALAKGDYETATSMYGHGTLGTGRAEDALKAALLMSRHTYELGAITAGDEVFTDAIGGDGAVLGKLIQAVVETGTLTVDEASAHFRQELRQQKLNIINTIRNPANIILATIELLEAEIKLGIDQTAPGSSLRSINHSWQQLEVRHGTTIEELAELRLKLEGVGLRYIRQWKHTHGYVGYGILLNKELEQHANTSAALESWRPQVRSESAIIAMMRAARTLNDLLGEERYVITFDSNAPQPYRSIDSEPTVGYITTIGGTCQSMPSLLDTELSVATVFVKNLHGRPDITEKLARLEHISLPIE